jgi:hypothetical protein
VPNITFTKDANSFSFNKGVSYPKNNPAKVNVVSDYSEGGQLYAYDAGVVEQWFNLTFSGLSSAVMALFENWLKNVANGPLNTFTFTDEDENNHTVRLMCTQSPLQEVSFDNCAGTIPLREEI